MIDRNKILKGLECHRNGFCFACPYNDDVIETTNCKRQLVEDVIELLKSQPEQKHGHWKLVQDYYDDEHWQCSACGCEWYLEAGSPEENNMRYCSECGAIMDEKVKQDE